MIEYDYDKACEEVHNILDRLSAKDPDVEAYFRMEGPEALVTIGMSYQGERKILHTGKRYSNGRLRLEQVHITNGDNIAKRVQAEINKALAKASPVILNPQ